MTDNAALYVYICSSFLVLHTLLLFPVIIKVLAWIKTSLARTPVRRNSIHDDDLPSISILIAAYNEEKNIRNRVLDIEKQDYPKSKLRVFIGSDGSTDSTLSLLNDLCKERDWLEAVEFKENMGKSFTINSLVELAETELLVFSDADVEFGNGALREIVAPFIDSEVGAVAGRRMVASNTDSSANSQEESSYLSFDNQIRKAEGAFGCVIGAHGCFFAMRKSLFQALDPEKGYTDDFYYSMLPLEAGFKVVHADNAKVFVPASKSYQEDFQRKVRYSATAFATLGRFWMLLFFKKPILSYCLWSHRVFKWFLPLELSMLFISNAFLVHQSPIFLLTFSFMLLMLLWAALGAIVVRQRKYGGIISFSYYFVVSNVALFWGFIRFLAGKNSTQWKPIR